MCTAITFKADDFYFGRTLDLEYSYNETVTITPRCYPFHFRNGTDLNEHYALMGMATVADNFPLYYEATNEKGLSMAGLNFPGNAHYLAEKDIFDNVASFELIPWILSQCENVKGAKVLLQSINITDTAFSKDFSPSPLHWIIADKNEVITLESTVDGLKIYDNPVGVLTNNPPFPYHLTHLSTFMKLSPYPAENRFTGKAELKNFSRGTGALGLPGDCTSQSRFVRASFNKLNAEIFHTEKENIEQFFHLLSSVEQIKGTVKTDEGKNVFTVYTSCCNADKGIYYYTTYGNRSITGVDMHKADLDGTELICYELRQGEIFME